MAVIFDEVTGEVRPETREAPAGQPPMAGPKGKLDRGELRRELELEVERHARLHAD